MIGFFKIQLTRAVQYFTRSRANMFLLLSAYYGAYIHNTIFTRAFLANGPCERPLKTLMMMMMMILLLKDIKSIGYFRLFKKGCHCVIDDISLLGVEGQLV